MSTNADELPEITVTAVRPEAISTARQPRAVVKINGQVVPGCVEFSVDNNSYLEADTWSVTFAASALPAAFDVNWFSEQGDTFVEIFAGTPADLSNPSPSDKNMQSLIYGRIDNLEYDPVFGALHLTGRDLTGVFIDQKIVGTNYLNQKAFAIAIALANSHGLKPDVTTTTTTVGDYYNIDYSLMTSGRSEWDLLAYLANHEGFVCFVTGKTLYFGPDPADEAVPYRLNFVPAGVGGGYPTGNFERLTLERSQSVTRGIAVTVMSAGSWYPSVKATYSSPSSSGSSSSYGATTNYYYKMPAGSSQVQVQRRAQTLYNEIIQHAMKLSVTLPANNIISSQSRLDLVGTGTAFDQTYYVMSVKRAMSFEEGYTMTVDAQNASPNLEQADDPGEPIADPLSEVNVTAQTM